MLENSVALGQQMHKTMAAWLEKETPLCDSLKQVLLEITGASYFPAPRTAQRAQVYSPDSQNGDATSEPPYN
jgi:hypothetical protein